MLFTTRSASDFNVGRVDMAHQGDRAEPSTLYARVVEDVVLRQHDEFMPNFLAILSAPRSFWS